MNRTSYLEEDREMEREQEEARAKIEATRELIQSVCNGEIAKMRLGLLKDVPVASEL